MTRQRTLVLAANVAAATILGLVSVNVAQADDNWGKCCKISVEGVRYCCVDCCLERINECVTNENCRAADQ